MTLSEYRHIISCLHVITSVSLDYKLNLHDIIRVSPYYRQVFVSLSEYHNIISSLCNVVKVMLHYQPSLYVIIIVSSHYQ
jgi:hypothetical protein